MCVPRKTKNRTARRLPDFVFFMGGAQLPFSVTSLPCENGIAERPQTLRYPEVKIIIPLKMAKAQAAAIFDRPALHPYPLRGAGDGGKQPFPRKGLLFSLHSAPALLFLNYIYRKV